MTHDEYIGWKSQRQTEEITKLLKHYKENALIKLMDTCSTANQSEDMVKASRYAGIIMGLDMFLELSWEELNQT